MQEVRCIGKGQDLTIGKVYTVLYETTTLFSIKNDSDHMVGYGKGLFENVPAGKVMRYVGYDCEEVTRGKHYTIKQNESDPNLYVFTGNSGATCQAGSYLFEKPTGKVMRYVGHTLDEVTHGKNYNVTTSDFSSDSYTFKGDAGLICHASKSNFEDPNRQRVREEYEEVNAMFQSPIENESHKYRVPIPQGIEYLDVYRICALYEIDDTSGAVHHAIKKLLKMGKRGYKDRNKDLQEVIDTLTELQKLGVELEV